jgi:hypothetical protein
MSQQAKDLTGSQGLSEDWGSWEAKRELRLVLAAEATPAQRLAWLEEALQLALRAGALPRRRQEP